jgi:hypothetical protein
MTDALDRTQILNVAIAEQPLTPSLPTVSRWMVLFVGTLLAVVVSIGMAFLLEYSNPSFRTPTEVLSELNIPVLAAVPHYSYAGTGPGNGGSSENGHGNGNGNGNGNGHGAGKSTGVRPVFVSHDVTLD